MPPFARNVRIYFNAWEAGAPKRFLVYLDNCFAFSVADRKELFDAMVDIRQPGDKITYNDNVPMDARWDVIRACEAVLAGMK